MNYTDIDIFLVDNPKGDFYTISGKANCVRNCLQNNLLVSSDEVPFDNSFKPNIYDAIHSDNILTNNMEIRDAIEWVALQDKRIQEIVSIDVKENTEYICSVTLKVKLIDDQNQITAFNFSIKKT